MSRRILELQEKVRTPKCDDTELEFRDNLEDLRLLVAKEYSCIIMGRLSIPITKCLKKYISSLIDHHKILLFLGGLQNIITWACQRNCALYQNVIQYYSNRY